MADVVRHEKYASVDILKNSNKVWEGKVFADGTFEASWGRVGGTMQSESKPFGSVDAANAYMNKKIAEKTKPKTDKVTGMTTMYEKVDTVDTKDVPIVTGGSARPKADKTQLSQIAKKQISHSNPVVAQLIDRLARENIHDIVAATGGKMSFDDTTGLFSTPLGVVTQETVDEARGLLVELGDFVAASDYGNGDFVDKMQRYMRRIPQDLGYGKITPQTVLPDLNAVQRQNSILDSLEASLKMVENRAAAQGKKQVKVDEPKVFDLQLDFIEDGKMMDRLRKLYRDTRKDMHVCSHLDVKRAFTVDLKSMRTAYEPVSARLGNEMELWHGTRTCNLLSILKGGLVVPPRSSGHVTGRMFGDGIYGATASTKSLNYAYGYWGGGNRQDNCFMFLCKFALGKAYTPRGTYDGPFPKPGYDSIFAKAGASGVQNDEIIVFRTDQVNLMYLLEFTPGGK